MKKAILIFLLFAALISEAQTITITGFSGTSKKFKSPIAWTVSNTTGIAYYRIQKRSIPGSTFSTIGFHANDTISTSPISMSYIDSASSNCANAYLVIAVKTDSSLVNSGMYYGMCYNPFTYTDTHGTGIGGGGGGGGGSLGYGYGSIITAALGSSTYLGSYTAIDSVGDGHSDLTISNTHASGSKVVVRPGTYNAGGGITITGCNNITVDLTGVILDGMQHQSSGYYEVLTITNSKNITVANGRTQGCGYHMGYFTGIDSNIVITKHYFYSGWQGWINDNTVSFNAASPGTSYQMMDVKFDNCMFDSCADAWTTAGLIDSATNAVTGVIRHPEFSNCCFKYGDGGDILYGSAVDSAIIANNKVYSVDLNVTNDNRLFYVAGTMTAYGNRFQNIGSAHCLGVMSVSLYPSRHPMSSFHDNHEDSSLRYSLAEFQEFAYMHVTGKTTWADLTITNDTCRNLNFQNYDFGPAQVDNYMYGVLGGHTYLYNSVGSYWYNTVHPYSTGVYWNQSAPTTQSGNSYSASVIHDYTIY